MKGSEWWARVPENLSDGRYTELILDAIRGGHYILDWFHIQHGDLEFFIMRAPLAIGTCEDHVFALGVSAEDVDKIALELERRNVSVMSPTPYLYDLASEHVQQQQIGPHTLPTLIGAQNGAAGLTKTAAKAHNDAIQRDRLKGGRLFISACCKTYILYPGYKHGMACEYGWRLGGKVGWGSKNYSGTGYVVQPAQWAHEYQYRDYSMGVLFINAFGKVRGSVLDFRKVVMSSGAEGRLLSPSGAVSYVTHPMGPKPVVTPSSAQGTTIQKGSTGQAVQDWQEELIEAGYSLAPYGADGDFGTVTHNATVSFQRDRGIQDPPGVVGVKTWQAVNAPLVPRPLPTGDVTAMILCKNFKRVSARKIDNVVLHSMEAAEASTTAENVAKWGAGPNAPMASWHYAIDDDSTILCVPEEHIAYCAPGLNERGIHIEHAGYARQTIEEWSDSFSRRMLMRSAKLVANICRRHKIPIVFVDAAGLMCGERGITTHYQVSLGPGKGRTSHTDPGKGFPMSAYLDMVKGA